MFAPMWIWDPEPYQVQESPCYRVGWIAFVLVGGLYGRVMLVEVQVFSKEAEDWLLLHV